MKSRSLLPLAIVFIVFTISSCSPVQVSYLGNDYSPSSEVTLYFSPRDIKGDFRVIGKMVLTAPEGLKSEKLQRKLEREARSKGADGALVEVFDQIYHGRRIDDDRHWNSSVQHDEHDDQDYFTGTYARVSLIKFD